MAHSQADSLESLGHPHPVSHRVGDDLPTQHQQATRLAQFWEESRDEIVRMPPADFKNTSLPLSRIKKIMKSDEEVRMISTEAPLLFAKACELFVKELTKRAWFNTEENKRKTLQRNDIAMAISKTDVYDFLIDIVPPDEIKVGKKAEDMMNVMTSESHQPFYSYPPMTGQEEDQQRLVDPVLFTYQQPMDGQNNQYRQVHHQQMMQHYPNSGHHVLHLQAPPHVSSEHHPSMEPPSHEYYPQPSEYHESHRAPTSYESFNMPQSH